MNRCNKLIKISKPLIQEMMKVPEIKGMVYYGSIAKGYVDKYSDIDIICFCTSFPDPEKTKKMIEKIGGKHKSFTTNVNSFYLDGEEVTLWFKLIKDIEVLLEKRFLKEDDSSQSDIDIYINATKIIYDHNNMIKKWKMLVKYPKWIEKRTINQIQFIGSIFEFTEQSVRRNNYIWISRFLEDKINELVKIIYALNNEYYSVQKWFFMDVKKFKIKPKNCLKRMEKIKNLNTKEDLVKKLILINDFSEDLYKLTKKKYPEFKPIYDYQKRKDIIDNIRRLIK